MVDHCGDYSFGLVGIGDNNISLSTNVNQVLSPVENDIFMGLGCKHTDL